MTIRDFIETERAEIFSRKKAGRFKKHAFEHRTLIMFVFGIVNISLGSYLTYLYSTLSEITINYTKPAAGTGDENRLVVFPFEIKNPGEYKLYIELSDFYQNFLNYTKSISYSQLNGEATRNVDSCDPIKFRNGKIIYPCGLISATFFNDTFEISGKEISTDDITWKYDRNFIKKTKYRFEDVVAPPGWQEYTNNELPNLRNNQRYINWINIATFPDFRKLYGKVFLEKGLYELKIGSTFPYGKKAVTLAQISWAGSKNLFLSTLMIVIGASLLLNGFLSIFID